MTKGRKGKKNTYHQDIEDPVYLKQANKSKLSNKEVCIWNVQKQRI
jgi:hypothetical protein